MAYEEGNEEENIEVFKTMDSWDISRWWNSVKRPMTTEESRISEEIRDREVNRDLNNQMYFGGYRG